MNNLESRYADHLRTLQLAGEIHSFSFERHNLKLADRTYYKPDFEVMMPDGTVEFHEVKGYMPEDANVKLKVVAQQFPQYVPAWIIIKRKPDHMIGLISLPSSGEGGIRTHGRIAPAHA